MFMRSCIYSTSPDAFKAFVLENSESILKLANKLRVCVMLNDLNHLSAESFNEDFVVVTNEIFSPYLTYILGGGDKPVHPSVPIINSENNSFWISDIDVWIGLPEELKTKMMSLGSHVVCYHDFKFLDL
jgi:hypothetical protein